MSGDPAIAAADKALDAVADDKRMFLDDWDVLTDTAIAAAREMAAPVRDVVEQLCVDLMNYPEERWPGLIRSALTELDPLLYSSSELEGDSDAQ
ncbi:hypothetical protein BJD62_gp55 [Gordonia phage Lucky10]|uniref:Uncharacterized protein n=1 Tax=Gordonia phage Lucky10 TaxID=1821557 RepID=A0A142KB15_9CAUD|nr:hypothetical protein BJD62_gp55 [Gordonia phage Lucky10]AMS03298.1 hypothetical protein SEA_LUCKY10_55 [Gordonia phage Lucky10]